VGKILDNIMTSTVHTLQNNLQALNPYLDMELFRINDTRVRKKWKKFSDFAESTDSPV
jgi:hypothetical protein